MRFFSTRWAVLTLCLAGLSFSGRTAAQGADAMAQAPNHDLIFSDLPKRWDEGIPLGNGLLGALVWQKEGHLRMSLDRADLWDNRKAFHIEKMTYQWVLQKYLAGQYDSVHQIGDDPYDESPYPTKIPAAALEFDMQPLGAVQSVRLDIRSALCHVTWATGATLQTFVGATETNGSFQFTHIPEGFIPSLSLPPYHNGMPGSNGSSLEGQGLERLGYAAGSLHREGDSWIYHQPSAEGNGFTVRVRWHRQGDTLTGYWTVTKDEGPSAGLKDVARSKATANTKAAAGSWADPFSRPYSVHFRSHLAWWTAFWDQCSLQLPDSLMEKQWYLERYKLGCVARKGAPPITLQAVWTADEGRLPPWKGDVHNDLNTQLSYQPVFSENDAEGAASFTDWLWHIRGACTDYAKGYFGVDGLNVPGVSTLTGAPMGGWIQYALSPTTGAWMAQYFHWQWKYWMDPRFLEERAYPYVSAVASYLEHITYTKPGQSGRLLPLSSSPEIFDNSTQAWFRLNTNFDQSLMVFLFNAASEEAAALGKTAEATHWKELAGEMGPLNTDSTGLTIAPGMPLTESHRHMSPYMAIYPLGLLTPDRSADKSIIDRSLSHLEQLGTRNWVGYSFCWAGSLFARAYQGDSAARYLKIFATNFCSSNSFHLNGDQKGGQYSAFTYRPFTLEGNFAFATGIQEMLLQSYNGYIRVFPAIPTAWKDVTFHRLRTEGGFLVDAALNDSLHITVRATHSGILRIRVPSHRCKVFGKAYKIIPGPWSDDEYALVTARMEKGEVLRIEAER